MKIQLAGSLWVVGLFAATSLRGDVEDQRIVDLDAFIVEETAHTQQETISPLSVHLDSLFGDNQEIVEIPRGVTVLSPETRELFGIDDYDDLSNYGAGTQRVNYFGLAGSAFLRGTRAGTYFNGMLRAYQRNQMPMSFGSLDGLELIKGPAPADLSPTLVGGYVNQRPKSPYYDEARGSVTATLGSWNERELQIDYGQPFMLGDLPAAYRASVTVHRSDRFYKNVPEDFESVYLAGKIKLNERQKLFIGGEYYDFRSREIPGANRPTPEFVSKREYVVGEPPVSTADAWGGTVARPLMEFPTSLVVNPSLFSLAVPGDLARERIPDNLRAHMIDLNDPTERETLYSVLPESEVPAPFRDAIADAEEVLEQVGTPQQDAFVYTPEYFEAGGEALTTQLDPDAVLADPRDKAEARDFIFFADLDTRLDSDRLWRNRLFIEGMETDKASSYGYAMQTTQFVANYKSEYHWLLPDGNTQLRTGLDFRYTYGEMLQDFNTEPFSRRDLSKPEISDNSIVWTGDQQGPDGRKYWMSYQGATQQSQLYQIAAFLGANHEVTDNFHLHGGVRLENALYYLSLPSEVDRAEPGEFNEREDDHNEVMPQVHLNAVWEFSPGWHAYAALQLGKALAPADGGTIAGSTSFTDVELYEGGIKTALLDDTVFSSLSLYYWDQATFSVRDVAARPLRAEGVEFETSWELNGWFSLIGAFTAQRVTLRTQSLGFGAIPQDEAGWALNGGILNATDGRTAPENPEMVFGGYPEVSANLYAVISGKTGWQLGVGPLWRDGYWHDMQRSLRIPSSVVWRAHAHWEFRDWEFMLRIENLLDEDYWIGQEPVFSAATLVTAAPGRKWEASVRYRF